MTLVSNQHEVKISYQINAGIINNEKVLAEIKYFYEVKGVRSPSALRGVVSLRG